MKPETVRRASFVVCFPFADVLPQTRVCGNCGQRGHMKTSRKLCSRWAEFNSVRFFQLRSNATEPDVLPPLQPRAADPTGALPSNFGGGLALPSMGGAPAPTAAAAAKATLKLKLGNKATPGPSAGAEDEDFVPGSM